MSLSLQAVDRLFVRLSATYGRDFASKYEGLDQNAVKSSWAHELAGFAPHLDALAWALENLPERAPNVIEFRAICRRAPTPEAPRIEHSPAGKERIAAELAKLGHVTKAPAQGKDYRAWARTIVARHEAGEKITRTQLAMAKDALKGVA
jgi:hypothetical protein